MPDLLGRSVYLTGFEKQRAPLAACPAGGAPVFVSLHIGEEFGPDYTARAGALCEWLRERGWRILADISGQTAGQFGCSDPLELARNLGLWGLRLDDGFTLAEACALAAQMPVAVNASTVTPQQAAALAAAGPQVIAIHNFYPRPETGLDPEFLLESTRMLQAAGLKVYGFIPGDSQLRGPLHAGLPTLEEHRAAAPLAGFADLVLRYGLDGVFAGDPGVSEYELEQIAAFCADGVLPLPVHLEPEQRGLYGRVFTCRPDSPRWLIRCQESRAYAQPGGPVEPGDCGLRDRGCVTMDNRLYGRYSGEIQLIREALPADERVNRIGRVDRRYLLLLDCIRRGSRFRLVRPPEGTNHEVSAAGL